MFDKAQMKEFSKLVAPVKEWLKDGAYSPAIEIEGKKISYGFNMNFIYMKDELDNKANNCGSVGCIAGSIAVLNNMGELKGATHVLCDMFPDLELRSLFYPPDYQDYEDITDHEALTAIENFEKFGDPLWEEIFEGF